MSNCNRKYAVGVSSGQNALEISLNYARLHYEGRYVIVQANAFVGDLMAILRAGFTPMIVDVDDSMQLDVECVKEVSRAIPEVAGVLLVQLLGFACPKSCDLEDLCKKEGWFLIEDACQAHGVRVCGKSCGSFGLASVFSFYATKVVTCGEGGILLTDDDDLYHFARASRNNGSDSLFRNEAMLVTGDCRMSDILAAIALEGSQNMAATIGERGFIAGAYHYAVEGNRWLRLIEIEDVRPNWYKYPVLLDGPTYEEVEAHFKSRGVALAGRIYDHPVFSHPAFKKNYRLAMDCDNAIRLCRGHACLPLYNAMSTQDVVTVLAAIGSFG